MSRSPHILFHRPTPWANEIKCSTKVLASMFAEEGVNVTYLQALRDPINLLRRVEGLQGSASSMKVSGNLNVISPFTLVPVRDIWPLNTLVMSALKYRLTFPSIGKVGKFQGHISPDVVWTTVPGSCVPLRKLFNSSKIIFHVIDYYPAFRGEAIRDIEVEDYRVADEIFVIGRTLQEYLVDDLKVNPSKIRILGQGVEVERFLARVPEPVDIRGLPHPRAIWCGVLEKGDRGLFERLVSEFQKLGGSVVMVGPSAEWSDNLADRYPETVKLTGAKRSDEVVNYMKHSDIGLMLYDRSRRSIYRGQNPLKLYEYAAAGLPILSTPHDEFTYLSPPVVEVLKESDISAATSYLLSNYSNLRKEALSFARNYSWRTKVRDLKLHLFPDWNNRRM